jgi:HEPN domain-containing protein
MNEKVKFWLMKAFEDWKVLEVEMKLSENEISTSAVCFHSQQFVEKLLKAYLTMKNIPFGRTHVLEVLLESCKTQDEDFSSLDLKNLSKYAVEIRYPDEFYIPSLEEARKCFEIASKTRELVLRKLGVEEKEVLEWIKEWMEK